MIPQHSTWYGRNNTWTQILWKRSQSSPSGFRGKKTSILVGSLANTIDVSFPNIICHVIIYCLPCPDSLTHKCCLVESNIESPLHDKFIQVTMNGFCKILTFNTQFALGSFMLNTILNKEANTLPMSQQNLNSTLEIAIVSPRSLHPCWYHIPNWCKGRSPSFSRWHPSNSKIIPHQANEED